MENKDLFVQVYNEMLAKVRTMSVTELVEAKAQLEKAIVKARAELAAIRDNGK